MLLNMKHSGDEVHIKGSMLYYVIQFIFYIGGLFGTALLIIDGLGFNSTFSLQWLIGGIVLFPVMAYLFIWYIPGIIPGKTIISFVPGPNGYFKTKKGNVSFKNIQKAEVRRNGFTLINVFVIITHDKKQYRIPTYNLVDETGIDLMIDKYVYPYMTPDARKVWNEQVNLEKLHELIKYKREDNMNM